MKSFPRTPDFNVEVLKLGGTIEHDRAFISHGQDAPRLTDSFNIEIGGKGERTYALK